MEQLKFKTLAPRANGLMGVLGMGSDVLGEFESTEGGSASETGGEEEDGKCEGAGYVSGPSK